MHILKIVCMWIYNASQELTLHDQKVGIVDIQLHRMEQVGHLPRRTVPSINEIFTLAPDENLPRDIDLLALLVPHRTIGLVFIVKNDCDRGLVDARLALFVDELGEVAGANLGEVLDAEHEADGVENVWFAGAVEACDGVEVRVESVAVWGKGWLEMTCITTWLLGRKNSPGDHRSVSIGFEPVHDDFFNVHDSC